MGALEILLVEDDFDLRMMLAIYLSEANFTVIQAADGSEALRLLETSPTRFSALITDHNMPLLTGTALVAACTEKRIHVPVKILMTGDLFTEEAIRALAEEHSTMFLKKPLFPSALLKILREFLHDHEEAFIA